MRLFLLIIAWASVAGSVFDGLIAGWLVFLGAAGEAPYAISVDAHLRNHLAFLYWVKDLALLLLPDGFVVWLFALPALVYFPVRVAMSVVIGGLAFSAARRLGSG